MIFFYSKKQKNKGFTILETLVAITIILIAITGPLDIIAHSLKASYYSRDEVTAFYLAQEAIEYARNLRDNNALDPNTKVDDWLNGVVPDQCLNDVGHPNERKCMLVQDAGGNYKPFTPCGSTCDVMKKLINDDDTGAYGVTDSANLEDTNFTREVYFTKVLDGSVDSRDPLGQTRNEVIMTVNIYWSNNFGSDNKFTLSTRLFNWKITE